MQLNILQYLQLLYISVATQLRNYIIPTFFSNELCWLGITIREGGGYAMHSKVMHIPLCLLFWLISGHKG